MNCSELREKLDEIKSLRKELVLKLPQAQNHEDTLILVNLQEKIEKKLESLEEILNIDIEDLERRHQEGKPLSKRELWFIYKLDKLFNKEIRVKGENIKERREKIEQSRRLTRRQDLAQALGCQEKEISLTQEEALSGNIKYHYGGLVFSSPPPKNLNLPKFMGGPACSLSIKKLTDAKDLALPEAIDGDIWLEDLITAEDLILPKIINNNLILSSLTTAKYLNLPNSIGGSLYLEGIIDATGLALPKSIGKSLFLDGLKSAKNLKLPRKIGVDLNLRGLADATELDLSAIDFDLSNEIKSHIYLNNLPEAGKEELRQKYPHLADKIQ